MAADVPYDPQMQIITYALPKWAVQRICNKQQDYQASYRKIACTLIFEKRHECNIVITPEQEGTEIQEHEKKHCYGWRHPNHEPPGRAGPNQNTLD